MALQSLKEWLVVIPARLGSERLPRKPLADLGGKPMIIRVAENLRPLAEAGAAIIVATDSLEVMAACAASCIAAQMTDSSHASGTDRCAEAAAGFTQPFILNVQGDEPFINTQALIGLMNALASKPDADMATLVVPSTDAKLAADPNTVKAVRSQLGFALYFSRAPLPYERTKHEAGNLPRHFYHHLGVYAFRRSRLLDFVALGPSPLEQTEKLEQLRALEAGWRLWLEPTIHGARGIDTPEDLEAARARFRK